MSKENLDVEDKAKADNGMSKSSINTPAEGVEEAAKSNAYKSSINTPEGVTMPNPAASSIDSEPQEEGQKERRVLKDDIKLKATRYARAGAAIGIVTEAAAEVGYHVGKGVAKGTGKIITHNYLGAAGSIVKGVFKGGVTIAEAGAKAFDPLDKVQKGGKIKEEGPAKPGLYDKTLDKIRTTLPGGNTIADGLNKTYTVLSSKGVKRMAKVGGAIIPLVPLALNPVGIGVMGAVGAGAAVLSLSAVAYNVGKETLEVMEDKKLEREKAALENIKANRQEQSEKISKAREDIAKNLPADAPLQKFLDTKIPNINNNPPKPSAGESFEEVLKIETKKSLRDTMLETASLFCDAASKLSLSSLAAAATTAFINITGEIDSNAVHKVRENDKKNQIDNLKLSADKYQNEKELQGLDRQERINTKTLEEFLDTPNIDKLNQIQLEAAFATKQKQVEAREEFAIPPEKIGFQKVKSVVKDVADCFIEAQFGEAKKVFSQKEMNPQPYIAPTRANNVQKPEVNKAHQQAVQEAHHLQNELAKGQTSTHGSTISSPQATPSASKHHNASVGR